MVSLLRERGLLGTEPGRAAMAAAIGGGLLFGVMLLLSYLFGFLNDEKLPARLLRALKREALEVHYQHRAPGQRPLRRGRGPGALDR